MKNKLRTITDIIYQLSGTEYYNFTPFLKADNGSRIIPIHAACVNNIKGELWINTDPSDDRAWGRVDPEDAFLIEALYEHLNQINKAA